MPHISDIAPPRSHNLLYIALHRFGLLSAQKVESPIEGSHADGTELAQFTQISILIVVGKSLDRIKLLSCRVKSRGAYLTNAQEFFK